MTLENKFFLTILLFGLFSCGIKGPPLAPIEEETVQKQIATDAQSAAVSTDATRPAIKEKKKK